MPEQEQTAENIEQTVTVLRGETETGYCMIGLRLSDGNVFTSTTQWFRPGLGFRIAAVLLWHSFVGLFKK